MIDPKLEKQISVEWLKDDTVIIDFQTDALPVITVDKHKVPKQERGGEARKLLGSSLANCLGTTLYYLLQGHKINFSRLTAKVKVLTKQEANESLVDEIQIAFDLKLDPDNPQISRLSRVQSKLNRGCLISRSLKKGIKIKTEINTS